MPEIRYLDMQVQLGTFERSCQLRDYSFDAQEDSHEVMTDKKIGPKIGSGASVKVIIPNPTVTDKDGKKWYKAIDEFGNTGFIRGEHLPQSGRHDLENLSQLDPKVKVLDKPYVYYVSTDFRDSYESEHKIREVENPAAAAETMKNIEEAKRFIHFIRGDIDFNDKSTLVQAMDGLRDGEFSRNNRAQLQAHLEKFYHKKFSEEEVKKIGNRFYNACGNISSIVGMAKLLESYGDEKVSVDLNTGKIETTLSPHVLKGFGLSNTLLQRDDNRGRTLASESKSREDAYDANTYTYAIRAYADKEAEERVRFSNREAKRIERGTAIPSSLTNPDAVKTINDQLGDQTRFGEFIRDQVGAHGGLCMADDHSSTAAKDYLRLNMEALSKNGIHTIYIEHFFEGDMQDEVDKYMHDPQQPTPGLLRFLNDPKNKGFKELMDAAKTHGVRIVGIGSHLSQVETGGKSEDMVHRARDLNCRATDIINGDQRKLSDREKGFVVLAGKAHFLSHSIDKTNSDTVIPGIGMTVGKNGEGMQIFETGDGVSLTRVDPTQRSLYYEKYDAYYTPGAYAKAKAQEDAQKAAPQAAAPAAAAASAAAPVAEQPVQPAAAAAAAAGPDIADEYGEAAPTVAPPPVQLSTAPRAASPQAAPPVQPAAVAAAAAAPDIADEYGEAAPTVAPPPVQLSTAPRAASPQAPSPVQQAAAPQAAQPSQPQNAAPKGPEAKVPGESQAAPRKDAPDSKWGEKRKPTSLSALEAAETSPNRRVSIGRHREHSVTIGAHRQTNKQSQL